MELIRSSLSDRYAAGVSADTAVVGSVQVVEVHVRAPLPVLGPLGPGRARSATGRAFAERQ